MKLSPPAMNLAKCISAFVVFSILPLNLLALELEEAVEQVSNVSLLLNNTGGARANCPDALTPEVNGDALLISAQSYADTRIERACVGDVTQFAPIKEYIAVEKVIDNSTGLVSSFNVSTTFTSFSYCKHHIDNVETMASSLETETDFELKEGGSKCYVASKSRNAYYLVKESRNTKTGIVAELKKVNVRRIIYGAVIADS